MVNFFLGGRIDSRYMGEASPQTESKYFVKRESREIRNEPAPAVIVGNSYKVKRWEMDERTALSRSWAQSRLLFSIQQSLL